MLKVNIQTDTHDSIEDALSALRLYKAYHEFETEGTFDQKLEELYKDGKQYVSVLLASDTMILTKRSQQNFKPPSASPPPSTSQPAAHSLTSGVTPHFAMTPGQLLQAAFTPAQFQMNTAPPAFFNFPNTYTSSRGSHSQQWRNR